MEQIKTMLVRRTVCKFLTKQQNLHSRIVRNSSCGSEHVETLNDACLGVQHNNTEKYKLRCLYNDIEKETWHTDSRKGQWIIVYETVI